MMTKNIRFLVIYTVLIIAPTIMFLGALFDYNLLLKLIDSRVQSLLARGEIIADSISTDAVTYGEASAIPADRLSTLTPNQSVPSPHENAQSTEFSLNPVRIGPLIRRMVNSSALLARIYDKDGYILVDSRSPSGPSNILKFDLPMIQDKFSASVASKYISNLINIWLQRLNGLHYDTYRDIGNEIGKAYPEVDNALSGHPSAIVRLDESGGTIISAALPIKRESYVRGALLLTQSNDDIDASVRERVKMNIVYYVASIIISLVAFHFTLQFLDIKIR